MPEMWELQQMQGLPLELKIRKSEQRITEWYDSWDGQVYVAFSGGKDSTVLLDIVRNLYPNVPAVFVDTGLEYPEIKKFVKTYRNVDILKPDMPFNKVIEKYGYPVVSKKVCEIVHKLRNNNLNERHRNYLLYGDERGNYGTLPKKWHILLDAPFESSEHCCKVMKKQPFDRYAKRTGRYPYIGMLADESRARTRLYLKTGCNAFDLRIKKSMPLGFWRTQDILEYAYTYDLPICGVYGDIMKTSDGTFVTTGVKNTGCMFCCFGVHLEQKPNRFQQMAKSHPKHYKFCMDTLGFATVLDYLHVEYQPATTLDFWIGDDGSV